MGYNPKLYDLKSQGIVFSRLYFFMCYAILFDSWFLLFLCFELGFLLVVGESHFVLNVVYHLGYLCVVLYVMISVIVSVNIGVHDNGHGHASTMSWRF